MSSPKKFHQRSMRETTGTQTIEHIDTWMESPGRPSCEGATCRLRVLYHVDLQRVGQSSAPDAFSPTNPWQMIGRRSEIFLDADGELTSLEDPTVSRKQFLMRWLEEEGVFEIEPVAGAKLGLRYLLPSTEGAAPVLQPLTQRTRLPPGACLAVGQRLLFGLEWVREPHERRERRMGLIGDSEPMWSLRKSIREVAAFRRPALVLGPTGSGKELVSHAIHNEGPRQQEPFVVANCAALPDHIVESLLFGHQKGAFTGADSDHLGFFREADRGTLFLDEIGELPMSLQPKLLRVIQDGYVRPVGSEKTVKVDVRLIAATNRDPEQEIKAGRLREDLYHRLATYLLKVPPLNERRFDIPELFVAFVRRFSQEAPQSAWLLQSEERWKKTIPLEWFLELLCLDWTGNVRQLENVAARVVQTNLKGPLFHPPPLPTTRLAQSSSSTQLAVTGPGVDTAPRRSTKEGDKEAESLPAESEVSELFQRSCELLELAHKTVKKLFSIEEVEEIWEQARDDEAPEVMAAKLEQAAKDRLLQLLEAHHFSQRRVCKSLGLSPSTLIKLMQQFGIPRPTDLTLAMIDAAIAEVGEDFELVARHLCVSPQGLKRQFTLLNLKQF